MKRNCFASVWKGAAQAVQEQLNIIFPQINATIVVVGNPVMYIVDYDIEHVHSTALSLEIYYIAADVYRDWLIRLRKYDSVRLMEEMEGK